MGRFFTRLLKPFFPEILLVSRSVERARRIAGRLGVLWGGYSSVSEADAVLATVPSQHLCEAVSKLAGYLKRKSVFLDVTSVKRSVVDRAAELLPKHVEYVSLHPLFSPSVRRPRRNLRVVVIPVRCSDQTAAGVGGLLEDVGFTVVYSTVEEHDKVMAVIQSAHHLSYLAYALTLGSMLEKSEIEKYATRSLISTLKMIRRLKTLLNVVKEIQMLNMYGGEAKVNLLESVRLLGKIDRYAWRRLEEALERLAEIKL